jgi:hypothetical protein
MNRTRTGWIALLALGLLGAASSACTSRTLPLPPPNVDAVGAPNAQGLVLIEGSARENASIGIVNDRTRTGVIVSSEDTGCSSTCAFQATVEAQPGDQLRVWQFFETSSMREVQVPE